MQKNIRSHRSICAPRNFSAKVNVRINTIRKRYAMPEQSEQVNHLTHVDERGNIRMVDVTNKSETVREAIAKARVRMAPHTVQLIEANQVSKGSVLEVAKIAAIMAAKQTSQLIPLTHPLPMTHIDVQFTLDGTQGLIYIESRTRTTYKTGVEVEALTATTIAAVTIYDMCKGIDNTITLEQAYIALKSGGKSGTVDFQPGPLK
jgi:cyclic pyranopterin monophosphate synthase